MKNLLLIPILIFWFLLLSGCSNWSKTTWQGAYYDGWIDNSNIVYWPIFTNYKGCKEWAINKKSIAYNSYAYCSKNCHDSVAGTPLCEEIVRTRAPLLWSITFDNY